MVKIMLPIQSDFLISKSDAERLIWIEIDDFNESLIFL